MSDEINIESSMLLDFLFVEIKGDQLEISCNHCMLDDVLFWKGDPNFISNTNWLVTVAEHLATMHPTSIRK